MGQGDGLQRDIRNLLGVREIHILIVAGVHEHTYVSKHLIVQYKWI